jgi:Mg2+ and Co2+ transporter CorA
MIADGHLVLVLHQIPEANGVDRKASLFWRNPEGAWQSHGTEFRGNTALLSFLRLYKQRLLELEQQESTAASASDYHAVLEHSLPILRATRGIHRSLQEAREKLPDVQELITTRDEGAALERTAELLVQDAQFGLNYIAARQAEKQSESAQHMATTAHKLNVLAAFFLPLTAITSLFGMEIKSGLQSSPEVFYGILGGSLLIGVIIALFLRAGRKASIATGTRTKLPPPRNPA